LIAVILSERSESKDLHFAQDGSTSAARKYVTSFGVATPGHSPDELVPVEVCATPG
jgi:hypothetical protein